MFEILAYGFMRNALIAALMVSVACGVVGTLVVLKKLVFMSGGISHSAFGGIGLGYLLGLNPVLVAIPFSLLASISVGVIGRRTRISEDVSIGILWAVGMAAGIIFVNLAPGYAPDLFSYLFGSILTVPVFDLMVMFILDMLIVTIFLLFHKEFYAISFDEEFATVSGVPVKTLYYVLLGMIGLSVVILIRVVGIILVIALLTIPTVISMKFTHGIIKLSLMSAIIGLICTVTGLFLSYVFNLTSGATIVMVLAAAFLTSTLIKRLKLFKKTV
ncbi:MAG: metal ABC transporter permease [Candidatus Odinarchaeum yellowstonii]|uniref:Metal ABC transporter permease n=1 Tax=Odinarchaeota yellowstonii (strain LCB_4) TaxID=1841599 RepID=A0AAF0D3M0_ODILC|nr:MAG: metal ABC transporter permease [Candidatus Odinarchaeum yellowstonii]